MLPLQYQPSNATKIDSKGIQQKYQKEREKRVKTTLWHNFQRTLHMNHLKLFAYNSCDKLNCNATDMIGFTSLFSLYYFMLYFFFLSSFEQRMKYIVSTNEINETKATKFDISFSRNSHRNFTIFSMLHNEFYIRVLCTRSYTTVVHN